MRAGLETAWRRSVMAILIMLAAADAVSAHRRDEYLQAARIAVEPEEVRVGLELTPGIEVADAVLADIDHDGDAALSGNEKDEYAARLATGLTLEVDGTHCEWIWKR